MTFVPATAILLFFVMILLLEAGRRLRARSTRPDLEGAGFSAIEGAVFGLFGLLLAFTFSGAVSRYDTHRQLIVEEANDIGTAYLRLDLLPAAAQPALRQLFRDYTTIKAASRIKKSRHLRTEPASRNSLLIRGPSFVDQAKTQ